MHIMIDNTELTLGSDPFCPTYPAHHLHPQYQTLLHPSFSLHSSVPRYPLPRRCCPVSYAYKVPVDRSRRTGPHHRKHAADPEHPCTWMCDVMKEVDTMRKALVVFAIGDARGERSR